MVKFGRSWGPHTWYLMHYLSFTWDKSLVKLYIKFFHLLKETIPCHVCYTNFKNKLSNPNYSIESNCKNKERMIKWIIDLHNKVNISNKSKTYSVNQIKNMYLNNGKIHFNNYHTGRFIKEFIVYNVNLGGGRKRKALKLMVILAHIYPSLKRRIKLLKFMKNAKRLTVEKWINRYLKCLK